MGILPIEDPIPAIVDMIGSICVIGKITMKENFMAEISCDSGVDSLRSMA